MDLHQRYPALSDLKAKAQKRLPWFVFEYLDSATGEERTQLRNRLGLDAVQLMPSILHGEQEVDLSVDLFGQRHPLPFGVSPVGMSGLFWPNAERLLAAAATRHGLPYGLSTVASRTPEEVGDCLNGNGWFQIYPPRDPEIRADMLKRARVMRVVHHFGSDRGCAGGQPSRTAGSFGSDQPATADPTSAGAGGPLPGLGHGHGENGHAADAADRWLCG